MIDYPKVKTCLWYDDKTLPAAEFYCSLLPGSRIDRVERNPEGQDMAEPGSDLAVEFTLGGTPYPAIDGGPLFTLDEAVSISVTAEGQAETDRLREALIADGGAESQCGWLSDRFGLSCQIVPKRSIELASGPNAGRVWSALMQMKTIDIAALEAAASGE